LDWELNRVKRRNFGLLLIALFAGNGCYRRVGRRGSLPPPVDSSTLGPGDQFEVVIMGEEKYPKEYTVAPDGTVYFPWIKKLKIAGKEVQQVAELIRTQLIARKILSDPSVIVNVKEQHSKRVTVGGQVAKPGDIPFTPGMTLASVIAASGGVAIIGDREHVLVTRKLGDGKTKTVSFSITDINEGNVPDVPLAAGDSVYVPERMF
jgi:polysaccharide biosynthesis/export protein VpsN